jgi:hypothetical protein
MKLKQLSIATFNLYNLNEPNLPIYTDTKGWGDDEYALKIRWTAWHIGLHQPDVFGFQELWHADSLRRALEDSGLKDEYDLVTPANANGKRITCAALVKKGLLEGEPDWLDKFPAGFVLKSSGDDPQTPAISVGINGFSRPVLHFTIRPREDKLPVHVFVCHFKSKAPTKVFNEDWYKADKDTYSKHATALGSALATVRRTAEATALRFHLTNLMKDNDNPVIVLGDLNDAQHSNTANILTEQPRYLMGDSVGGSDVALYTAQTLQEFRDTRDVYYTHVHEGMRESLDHILVSQEFYDHSRKRLWMFDGMVVYNDHLNAEDHKADGTNDHGIIRATFKYKPAS